jgi:acyl-CoA thioester hydrolase
MRPQPFHAKPIDGNFSESTAIFVRDENTGLVWHRCSYRTLYADTDRSQVVYHANYLRYFEFGRGSLMRDAAYPYREIEASGYVYPVIEMGATFHQPLFYDDAMWIHTRPSLMERVKLQFDYIITKSETEELICTGFTRHCALNGSNVPVKIDPKTIHLWNNFPR